MIKPSINLQDLRRKIYVKAKSESQWRFWGLYVHICKADVLREAYRQAKRNRGTAGIDNMTFNDIEVYGVDKYLEEIRKELVEQTYKPMRPREVQIPKSDGKSTRTLKIAAIRGRIVQGAVKLIIEPIFEADFKDGSYGYRPKRSAAMACQKVTIALLHGNTKAYDVDIEAYFDRCEPWRGRRPEASSPR